MQTCIRRRLRGIAQARWMQGNVGSADDPHRLALSAAKTRHTGAQAHARRDNDGPRILERGVDDPLNLDENPRQRRAFTVLSRIGHGPAQGAVNLCAGDLHKSLYNLVFRSNGTNKKNGQQKYYKISEILQNFRNSMADKKSSCNMMRFFMSFFFILNTIMPFYFGN